MRLFSDSLRPNARKAVDGGVEIIVEWRHDQSEVVDSAG
jgi:hypothetical protein